MNLSRLGCLALLIGLPIAASAATVSPLSARGYQALPQPQKISIKSGDFEFTPAWHVELGAGVKPDDVALGELNALLAERFHVTLVRAVSGGPVLRLAVVPGTVSPSSARDRDTSALAEQAYRLTLAPDRIEITGNSTTGLFYGVGTLVQLLKPESGKLLLPESTIEDWPDLQLRTLYWDDAHHLEPLPVLKAALRQASFYKINAFALKLEGHFQYEHAMPVVDPYALSSDQLQELTDYGLKYHVQLIPYLDGPAHVAFILKHPEYASLREYPDSNYEFCSTNPRTYELLEGMFADLLAANQGGKYFVLSTDEPYYIGLASNAQCSEAARAKQLGSVGKLLAEFVTKTAGYLRDHGRTVIFWGEYPMKPGDIDALPNDLVNGEVYGPLFDPVFRAHGIRQMIYTSTEGEEQLFPQYYLLPSPDRLHPAPPSAGRVREMLDSLSFRSLDSLSSTRPDFARSQEADLMGAFVAGWGDAGLHPETFWLGYATALAAAWNGRSANAPESQSAFYSLFYGPGGTNIGRLYQLMSEGAQAWEDSWETGPSAARKPIWGNWYAVFDPSQPALDQYLPALPVPSPELLRVGPDWRLANKRRLDLTAIALARSDELLDLLHANLNTVQLNRYNLEVYLSIAGLYRHGLLMLEDFGRIAEALGQAESAAAKNDSAKALESLDLALDLAESIRQSRNAALANAAETWSKTWLPRVAQANGRTFLNEVDDVKDHRPVRTVDMTYLVYRELLYPLGHWYSMTVSARNRYAGAHHLAPRQPAFDWSSTN